jgi:acetyl-CoA carboxylase biotin carboxylase subunit
VTFAPIWLRKLNTNNGKGIEAIDRMKRALKEMKIEGIKTTIPFHLQLMDNPDFRKGNFTTKFLEDFEIAEEE